MKKNQKLIIAGLGLLALFFAYKKGVFGSKSANSNSSDATATDGVVLDPTAETITPTGDPQGVIVLPTNFANLTPANSSMTYA